MTAKASENVKLARGTARKDRSKPKVVPKAGRPVKPDWLGPVADAKWDEVVLLLESENQLAPAYGDFIAMYCQGWEDFHEASRVIADEGEYVHSEKGGIYQHPAVGVRNKAIERVHKFGRQLGLSGASIQHVQKNEKRETPESKKRFFG